MTDFVVDFWNYEEIGDPPANRTKEVNVEGATRAILSWDVNVYGMGGVDKISFNGVEVSRNARSSVDVLMYLVENGNNTVKIDYRADPTRVWQPKGKAYVTLKVSAEQVVEKKAVQAPKIIDMLSQPWFIVLAIILIVIIIVLYMWVSGKTAIASSVAGAVRG